DKVKQSWRKIRATDAYPSNCDQNTKKFVKYWFDSTNRRQLFCFAKYIRGVRDPNLKNLLWCAFSRLIITKSDGSSLARDLAHSRPHKVSHFSKFRPVDNFLNA